VDFKRELCMAFGDFVEAYEGTDNTSRTRSSACIALYPTANSTGAWVLWKISNQSKVRRTNYVKLVTNESIINAINQIAVNEEQQVILPSAETQEDARGDTQEQAQEDIQPEIQPKIQPEIQHGTQEETEEDAAPEEIEEAVDAEDENEEELTPQDVTRTRSGRAVVRPSRFMGVTKVSHEDWKMKANEKAISGELKMLFEELKALRPVRRASIKGGTKILRSHMFVVEKYLAGGEFDKMKARLVADGRDQDGSMHPDKASPKVAIHSVFTALGLMVSKEWLIVAKIDVKGAFVQTPMEGEPVYMKVDPKITRYVIKLFPDLAEFVEGDGCL
jgi:hypothetical protein